MALKTPTVPRLVSKRTVKCFFDTESLDCGSQSFLNRGLLADL